MTRSRIDTLDVVVIAVASLGAAGLGAAIAWYFFEDFPAFMQGLSREQGTAVTAGLAGFTTLGRMIWRIRRGDRDFDLRSKDDEGGSFTVSGSLE